MADKQVSYQIKAEATGQESIARMADELDGLAKTLGTELSQKAQSAAAKLRELGAQDSAISNFIQIESQAEATANALSRAESEASQFARQITAIGPPTAQESANLQRLQIVVDATRTSFGQQLEAVSRAQAELQRFGVAGQSARGVQERLRAEIVEVTESVKELSPAFQNAATASTNAGATMVRTHRAVGEGVDSISTQLARLQQFYVGLQSLKGLTNMAMDFAKTADEVNNLQSRVKTVTGEAENFTVAWQSAADVALRTHSALEGTGVLFTKVAQTGKDAGLSTAQAIQQSLALTETINQSIQLSGASADASNAAITQLVQGLQSGLLRGDEFNSVMEQAPRLARALAEGLGLTTGELRKMAEAGALTSATVIKALQGQSDVVAAEFNKLPPTVGRALQDLSTQWSLYIAETDKATGASTTAASAINLLSSNLSTIAGYLIDAGQAAAGFAALKLAQYFLGIGAATVAATTATAAHTAATIANTSATSANAAAKSANTAATAANAAANAAAAANTSRFAGAFSGLGAEVRAANTDMAASAVTASRFMTVLAGLRTFTLIGLITNFKDIGTWIGESAAKLAGYKDRTEELARAEKLQAEIAKEATADRARLAAAIQEAIDRQFELSKAARTAAAGFEQLMKDGEKAADAIKKVTENFDLTKMDGIKDFSATLDKLVTDGKLGAAEFEGAWAQALSGKDLAQFEVMARATFTGSSREGERLAQVLDATLREAVRRTGLEFSQLKEGIGRAARSALNDVDSIVNGLESLKQQGIDVGRVLTASLVKAIDTADSQAAIDSLKLRIESLRGQLGEKITDGLLDQAKVKADELKDAIEKATPGINGLREAMKTLGVTSDESLKLTAKTFKEAYETMVQSGTSSARELSEAFKKSAEAAIAANKGIAPSWVIAQAALRGYDIEADKAGKSTLKLRDATNSSASAADKATGAIVAQTTALERLNAEREREIASQEKANQLKERELELYREKWNIDKDGFTKDSSGNRQQMTVHTAASVYNQAKDAGLNEKDALKLTDRYSYDNGNSPNASDVNKAINDAIVEAARAKVNQEDKPSTTPSVPGGGSGGGSSGGGTYVNQVTIYADGGVTRGTTTHTTSDSAKTEIRLLEQLAQAKGVAQ